MDEPARTSPPTPPLQLASVAWALPHLVGPMPRNAFGRAFTAACERRLGDFTTQGLALALWGVARWARAGRRAGCPMVNATV
jgi:hypothetical protein